tara:strand:- start:35 stop:916 length:882 start_codon:yes stop_codon:yes gene_type:complete
MVKLSGAIGYSLLKKNNKYILILSDIHSKQPYCKNGVMIDDYLKFSNDQNNTILLEEVSREGIELKALWSEAEHTNRLKDLFLKNNYSKDESNKIIPIDIRPYLVPFSWELLLNKDISDTKKNLTLNHFLVKIKLFFNLFNEKLSMELIKTFLKNIFVNIKNRLDKNKNSGIVEHYKELSKYFLEFLNKYKKYMDQKIIDVLKKDPEVFLEISNILSNILEWYTVLEMGAKNNNVIIHSGLAHTYRINSILKKYYKYQEIESDGIVEFNPENISDNIESCVNISDRVIKIFNS